MPRYISFDWVCGCVRVLVDAAARIMGCVGSINASRTSAMNDSMFLFVIERRYELPPQQTAQSKQTQISVEGKKSPIIVSISLFSCVVPDESATTAASDMIYEPDMCTIKKKKMWQEIKTLPQPLSCTKLVKKQSEMFQ